MNFNYKQKNFNEPVEKNLNKNDKILNQEQSYSYYSKLLQRPFDTVNELKRAEAAHLAELKAKEDKAAVKKADAKKVEEAFKALNATRKSYRERLAALTSTYTQSLKTLKDSFEKDRQAVLRDLAGAEEAYSAALKAFTDKYPEGYHLTLKDGDFETTISSQTHSDNKAYSVNTIGEILDLMFNF